VGCLVRPFRLDGGSRSFRRGSAGPAGVGVGWLFRRAPHGVAGLVRFGVVRPVWPAPHGWVARPVRAGFGLVRPGPHGWRVSFVSAWFGWSGRHRRGLTGPARAAWRRGSCSRRRGLAGPACSAWLGGRACSGRDSAGLARSAWVLFASLRVGPADSAQAGWSACWAWGRLVWLAPLGPAGPGLVRCGFGWFGHAPRGVADLVRFVGLVGPAPLRFGLVRLRIGWPAGLRRRGVRLGWVAPLARQAPGRRRLPAPPAAWRIAWFLGASAARWAAALPAFAAHRGVVSILCCRAFLCLVIPARVDPADGVGRPPARRTGR
jgi:hypothetical protein